MKENEKKVGVNPSFLIPVELKNPPKVFYDRVYNKFVAIVELGDTPLRNEKKKVKRYVILSDADNETAETLSKIILEGDA